MALFTRTAKRSVARGFSLGVMGLAACTLAVPAVADTQAGVRAWSAGDYDRAVEEWRIPAQNGDRDALFNLAQAYRLGRGVVLDLAKARDFYAAAAAKGHVRAADNYGLLLFGQGDRERAIPLVQAASNRGDPRAQYVLGLAHFNGEIVEKDWVRGYALVTLAQKAGLPQAGSALEQMDQFITLDQRQSALALTRAMETEGVANASTNVTAPIAPAAKPVLVAGTPEAAPARTALSVPATRTTARTAQVETKPVSQPAGTPLAGSTPPSAAPQPKPSLSKTTPAPKRSGDWALQLGAFGVKGNAERLWGKLEGTQALSGASRLLQEGRKLTVLYATGFASRAEAAKACSSLKSQRQDCLVLKTPG